MCLLSSSLPSISYGDRSLYRDEDLEEVEEDEDEDERKKKKKKRKKKRTKMRMKMMIMMPIAFLEITAVWAVGMMVYLGKDEKHSGPANERYKYNERFLPRVQCWNTNQNIKGAYLCVALLWYGITVRKISLFKFLTSVQQSTDILYLSKSKKWLLSLYLSKSKSMAWKSYLSKSESMAWKVYLSKSKSMVWKFYLSKSKSMAWKFYLSKSTEKKNFF